MKVTAIKQGGSQKIYHFKPQFSFYSGAVFEWSFNFQTGNGPFTITSPLIEWYCNLIIGTENFRKSNVSGIHMSGIWIHTLFGF
jgi:hypothetical protein